MPNDLAMHGERYCTAEYAFIRTKFNEGWGDTRIALALKRTPYSVYAHRLKLQLFRRSRNGTKRRPPPRVRRDLTLARQILRHVDDGNSYREVARLNNVTVGIVASTVRDYRKGMFA